MPEPAAGNGNGNRKSINYSLEIFPPHDPQKLKQHWHAVEVFCKLKPTFISVTCGAFGNTARLTEETCIRVRALGGKPAAHMTCLNKTPAAMRAEITNYKKQHLCQVVALRGDPPKGSTAMPSNTPSKSDKLTQAIGLVEMLAEIGGFDISVAAYPETHPEAPSSRQDIQHLKAKLDAGAHRAITQFFLDPETFLRFRDKVTAAGITKPVIPGILPILNFSKVCSFAKKCRVSIPDFLLRMYEEITDDTLDRKLLAMNILSHQITRLTAEGVHDFHFYTLNETLLNFHICRWLREAF